MPILKQLQALLICVCCLVLSTALQGQSLHITPPTLNFPSVTVGTSSALSVSIQNPVAAGGIFVTITSITVTGDYSQTNNCPKLLSSPNPCTMTVTFSPTTTGSRGGDVIIKFTWSGGSTQNEIPLNGTGVAAPAGMINPKYLILSVQYAPPGAKSVADYGTSTNQGTTTSTGNMFSKSNSVTVTVKTPTFGDIFGIPGSNVPNVGVTTSFSNSNTQEMDSTSTFAVTKMSSFDTTIPGPATNAVGLDHTADTITIWLNPVVALTTPTSNTVQVTNLYWDTNDGCNPSGVCNGAPGMDTVTLSVAQLLNPSLITDQFQLNQLARNWAPNESDGSLPGLTVADLQAIAAADPFSDPNFDPTFTLYSDGECSNASGNVSAGRYCLTTNNQVQYAGPQQGGQSGSTTYKHSYTVTATEAQKTVDTHQIGFSVDVNASGGFLADWSVDVKNQTTLTWANTWSKETSNTNSTSASTTIVPPSFSDHYNGPTQFAIYQDSIYGTFMYLPVLFPGWLLSATPSSQTVTPGGQTTFTSSTTAVDGGTGTVAFSVSGLPTGASATFSPASVAVGGSSTLTVTTTSATPAGTYTLTISGAIGTNLPHSEQVTLVVN